MFFRVPYDTIGRFFFPEVCMYICLPQSLIDVKRSATAMSYCTTQVIDVYPYKMTWWWIHPPMCVKCVPYSGVSPTKRYGLIHVLLLSNLIIIVWITIFFSNLVMFRCGHLKLYLRVVIDVYPYKRAWWWIHPPMNVKSMPYSSDVDNWSDILA